jgi:excisionase family DNA binding protein
LQATPTLLTTKEASSALRISRWKLYDLIRRRKIDTIQIGRRRLVPADALVKLVDELREESIS